MNHRWRHSKMLNHLCLTKFGKDLVCESCATGEEIIPALPGISPFWYSSVILHTKESVEIGCLLFLHFSSFALRRFQVSEVLWTFYKKKKNRDGGEGGERLKNPMNRVLLCLRYLRSYWYCKMQWFSGSFFARMTLRIFFFCKIY